MPQVTRRIRFFSLLLGSAMLLPACRQPDATSLSAPGCNNPDSLRRSDSLAMALAYKEPGKAADYATRALRMAKECGGPVLIRALNIRGLVFFAAGNDSAQAFLDLALRMTDTSRDQTERPYIFYNLSEVYKDVCDYTTTRILLDSSIRTGYRCNQPKAVCVSLISLGTIYQALNDSAMTRRMYDSALRLSGRFSLNREYGIALGNLAHFHPLPEAEKMVRDALDRLERVPGTEPERANFLVNLGLLQTDPARALRCYQEALALAANGRAELSAMAAYNNMAYAWLETDHPDSAEDCILRHALPLAETRGDHDWLATLHDTYADVLMARNRCPAAVLHLRKSGEERVMADQTLSKKQVQLLNNRLETKDKDLKLIEQERRIGEKDKRIGRLAAGLAMAGLVVISVVILLLMLRQRARGKLQRIKFESAQWVIAAEEREKEMLAMELHDGTGALSLQVRDALDRDPTAPESLKKEVMGQIARFSEGLRRLSYRMNSKTSAGLTPAALIGSLCEDMRVAGAMDITWTVGEPEQELPQPVILHLLRIVQELLTNARRHAPDAHIRLEISFAGGTVRVEYHDNGPGFDPTAAAEQGMGISNIFARATLLNGSATLDTAPGSGVYWEITARL